MQLTKIVCFFVLIVDNKKKFLHKFVRSAADSFQNRRQFSILSILFLNLFFIQLTARIW